MKAAAILPLLLLAACASASREPAVKVVEVKVPVPVTCVPKSLGPAPVYPDSDDAVRASAGPGDLLQLLAAGRLLRKQRLAELEPAVAACRPPDPG